MERSSSGYVDSFRLNEFLTDYDFSYDKNQEHFHNFNDFLHTPTNNWYFLKARNAFQFVCAAARKSYELIFLVLKSN